ncbi:DUF3224 domain-containing protein [Alteromonas australica]|uniref:DUF3224 domain-containing protein n=1 Tax=Alteromonas australica TaxID=589873 RepID=UPI002357D58A|nr:DUF3224 domain-containing protein [Alteromonas australica]|tara:strand:+ start:318 stop:707 length:390 start_codon:yes stop_codon:yes gene_type:complete
MSYKGSFSIQKWDEETLNEKSEGVKTSHATIKQTYTGDMSGESDVEFLMSYQSETKAKFVGFEFFVGVIDGARGSVTLQHNGRFENGVASSAFTSIEDSATGELAGRIITGSFRSGESGVADYELTLAS